MENFIIKSVDIINIVDYNRDIKKGNMEKSEIDKQLQNKNLSESERRVLEIAKECGMKRLF